jgi:hypothetical protein
MIRSKFSDVEIENATLPNQIGICQVVQLDKPQNFTLEVIAIASNSYTIK